MRIRTGYEIVYELPAPTPMLLMLNVHPTRIADLETPDLIHTNPLTPLTQYRDIYGNLCSRILAPAGRFVMNADFIVRDDGLPDPVAPHLGQLPVADLPDEALLFLLGSRYCETDQLSNLAWSLFGSIPPGWGRVQAIVDYAHQRIKFGYEHARPTKTAYEAHEEGLGVCRDYAHLALTLCRCMNIPARYCMGFLGDIRLPPVPGPMDFSGWFEVYLDDHQWHSFDARHNTPRIGRILMAHGRDATDTAITTTFGPNFLAGFTVITKELPDL
ncbi:transglutaminase-like domain-containing protein [Phenylobacterium sp.]|uniref:transglutaminase-like domain-containing protein n=1 Tax=Phenylobacterium sp. TaxID=1871053 RepID=UPI0039833691